MTPSDAPLLKALKALAHPTRFRMVQEIAAAGELSCGQLGERFHLAQPTISHHLKLLADSGVVNLRKEAQHHFITVNREMIQGVLGYAPRAALPAGGARRPEGRRQAGAADVGDSLVAARDGSAPYVRYIEISQYSNTPTQEHLRCRPPPGPSTPSTPRSASPSAT